MSNIYRGAILNEIASFFNSQVSRYSEEIKTVKRESAAMKSELESLKLKLKFCSRSATDGIIKECQVVHIPRSAKLPSLARASRKNCSSLTTQIALLGLCHEFFSVLLWLKLGWNFFVSSCSYLQNTKQWFFNKFLIFQEQFDNLRFEVGHEFTFRSFTFAALHEAFPAYGQCFFSSFHYIGMHIAEFLKNQNISMKFKRIIIIIIIICLFQDQAH